MAEPTLTPDTDQTRVLLQYLWSTGKFQQYSQKLQK